MRTLNLGEMTCRDFDFLLQDILEGYLCSTGRFVYGPSCGCGISCANGTALWEP